MPVARRWARFDSQSWRSGDALREEARDLLRRTTGADLVVSYTATGGDRDANRLVDMRCAGSPLGIDVCERLEGSLAPPGCVAHRSLGHSASTIAMPPRDWINRFIPFGRSIPRQSLTQQRVWDEFYGPLDVADQSRMLVYSREHFVSWVACLRTGRDDDKFNRHQRAAAAASSDGAAWAFVKADAIDRARFADGGRLVVVLDSEGQVLMRSHDMVEWLRAPKRLDALGALIRGTRPSPRSTVAWMQGFRLELLPLQAGDRPHWMVTVRLHEQIAVSPLVGLTPRQREIARLLARGATLHEISIHLAISVNTVKYHAKLIHRQLDVASRAELVRRVGRHGSDNEN